MVGLIELGHLCIIKQWDNHLFTYARVSATFIATSFLFQHKDTMLSARPRGSPPPLHLPPLNPEEHTNHTVARYNIIVATRHISLDTTTRTFHQQFEFCFHSRKIKNSTAEYCNRGFTILCCFQWLFCIFFSYLPPSLGYCCSQVCRHVRWTNKSDVLLDLNRQTCSVWWIYNDISGEDWQFGWNRKIILDSPCSLVTRRKK